MPVVYESGTYYVGAVLATRERNYHDDSDFYAVVWNDEKACLFNEQYNTTRYGGGGSASVDATPETIAKANAYAYSFLKDKVYEHYINGLKMPEKNDKIKIVRGRNGKGAEGTVFWIGPKTGYNYGRTVVQKVGIALDDEKNERGVYKNVVWTYLHNIEVLDYAAKFRYSEIKSRLMILKARGWSAWVGYMAYPLHFVG